MGDVVAMKFDPIPEGRPVTIARVAQGLNQLHECVEEHKAQTAELVKTVHEIKAFPMKAARWILFAILSSAVGTIGSNYILHDAATRDAQRAVVAAQTSAQTAATTEAKVTKIAKAIGTEGP